ncbi:FKBP-type peptidyl-prolyl cis-trans isomerase [Bacteroidota bacterium]
MKNIILKYSTILLLVIILIVSCKSNGWEKLESGLEIKFIERNTEGKTAVEGDILVLDIKYYNENEELIDQNDYFRTQLGKPSYKGGCFEDALLAINTGDSAVFILDAQQYYEKTRKRTIPDKVKAGEKIFVNLRFLSLMEIAALEKERRSIYHTDETQEMRILESFLERSNIKNEPLESGVYVIITEEGKGEKAEIGNVLTINFTGTLIDGKIFESTLSSGKPYSFKLGGKGVLQGFNEAFIGMRVGTKAKLIIPSKLAYAEEGFKDIILPFSTLIFNIDLISVRSPK